MRFIAKIIAFLTILLLLPWALKAQGVLPAGNPEFDFLYDRLERRDALSRDSAAYQLAPYSLELASPELGPFGWLNSLEPSELRLFGRLDEDFRSVKEEDAVGYESLRGGGAARPLDNVFVYGSFSLDEQLAKDPTYTGKKWRGLAGGVDEAFVQFRTGGLSAMVGRFASFWGPRNSFVISNGVSMDGLGYSYAWGRLTLSYRLARLDGLNPDIDPVTQFENRYLAAHRLDIRLSRAFKIGLFESIVFGGPGRQVELYYLNPILPFHFAQLNDGIDDNTFLGFDFAYEPGWNTKFYGQLFIDDFQVDDKAQTDKEPNEIGLIAGFYAADLLPSLDVKAEYSRVTNRTFNQVHPRNKYLYKDELIGGALGNDYDLIDLRVIKWLTDGLYSAARLSYHRQGEGDPSDEWTTPWMDVDSDYSEPFPTGTVEKNLTAALQLKGFMWRHLFVDITGGVERIRNFDNVGGDDRTLPFVNLTVSMFASSRIGVE